MKKSNKSKLEEYSLTNKKTGKIIADNAILVGNEPFVDKGFRKVFVGFLKDVVLDKEISGKAIRLLLYIIENLKPHSVEVYLYHKDVCEELEISSKTYFRWLNILLEKKLIEKTERPGIFILKTYTAVNGQMNKAIKSNLNK